MADVVLAAKRFREQGGDAEDLERLVKKCAGKGRDPAALLAHLLDKGEWQKELQRKAVRR